MKICPLLPKLSLRLRKNLFFIKIKLAHFLKHGMFIDRQLLLENVSSFDLMK